MNCFEFRRQFLANPASKDAALLAHRQECRNCHDFALEIERTDRELFAAMHVDVPHNLRSRILLRQSLKTHDWPRLTGYMAMAASVLIAIMIALWQPRFGNADIDDAVVAYLKDSEELATDKGRMVNTEEINDLLQPMGMMVDVSIGPVQAIKPCVIRGRQAAHLVLAGEKSPVNVLYMPEEPVERRMEITYQNQRILIIPCPRGSFAIVGQTDETLARVEHRLHEASSWL